MERLFAWYSVLCLDLLAHNWIIDLFWRTSINYLVRTIIFFKEMLLSHFIQAFLELSTIVSIPLSTVSSLRRSPMAPAGPKFFPRLFWIVAREEVSLPHWSENCRDGYPGFPCEVLSLWKILSAVEENETSRERAAEIM